MNTTSNATAAPASTVLAPVEAAVPVQAPVPPVTGPSIHVRAVITWLAIFPLVAVGMMAAAPLTEEWHPVLRALVLTLVVVPVAVYLVLPRLFAGYGTMMRRRNSRETAR